MWCAGAYSIKIANLFWVRPSGESTLFVSVVGTAFVRRYCRLGYSLLADFIMLKLDFRSAFAFGRRLNELNKVAFPFRISLIELGSNGRGEAFINPRLLQTCLAPPASYSAWTQIRLCLYSSCCAKCYTSFSFLALRDNLQLRVLCFTISKSSRSLQAIGYFDREPLRTVPCEGF